MAKDETKTGQSSGSQPASTVSGNSAAVNRMAAARAGRGRSSGPDKSVSAKAAVSTLRLIRSLAKMVLSEVDRLGEIPEGVDLSILADAQAMLSRAVK